MWVLLKEWWFRHSVSCTAGMITSYSLAVQCVFPQKGRNHMIEMEKSQLNFNLRIGQLPWYKQVNHMLLLLMAFVS